MMQGDIGWLSIRCMSSRSVERSRGNDIPGRIRRRSVHISSHPTHTPYRFPDATREQQYWSNHHTQHSNRDQIRRLEYLTAESGIDVGMRRTGKKQECSEKEQGS